MSATMEKIQDQRSAAINQTTSWSSIQQSGRRSEYLHPGQLHWGVEPTAITTILGSCVAVCICNPHLHQGGVVHYILPGDDVAPEGSLRHGTSAIEILISKALACGRREHLVAKIFGGASMFQAFSRGSAPSLGSRNVEVAQTLLIRAGISVRGEHVRGDRGRKVVFHTDDGEAWVKCL